jgi:diguanylate cyclase (GGDEF)-like protein/PAS domain S-box-containing protein
MKENFLNADMNDSFHFLFELIEDCIYIHDLNGRFIKVNQAVVKTYGWPYDYYIGKTPEDFGIAERNNADEVKKCWKRCMQGQTQRFEYWTKTQHGRIFPKEVILNLGTYAGQKVIIAVARDISKTKELENELREYAEHDYLTGLYNRRMFFELAGKAIAYSKRSNTPLSVLMIDIDHFKTINDQYGHSTGDKVLLVFSQTLTASIRDADILARVGGEEFAIVMLNSTIESASIWANRFLSKNINLTMDSSSQDINVTASIGIASLSQKNAELDTLINFADLALYDAKEHGRNCCRLAKI